MKVVVWLLIAVMLTGIAYTFSTCRAEQSDGRVELTMYSVSYPAITKLNRQRIALFEKKNPDIKVRMVTGIGNKLLMMVSGGVPPDVAMGTHLDIPHYAKRGALLALDKYIDDDKGFTLNDYFPVAVESVHYKGEVYALPDNGSPVALVYNKDMFDKHNDKNKDSGKPLLEYPNEKWTWDDFRRAAKALTKDDDNDGRTDVFGAFVPFSINRWPILVWQYGGEPISKDKKRCLMDTPQAIAGIQLLHDILWVDKSSPTPDTQIAGVSQQTAGILFKEERIAMWMTTRYLYSNLKGKTKFTWDIAPLPRGPVNGVSLYISNIWMVSSKTLYKEQSYRLAKFLVSEESSRMCMSMGRAIVSHQEVAEEMLRNPDSPGLPAHDYMWIDIMHKSRSKDFEYGGKNFSKAMDELFRVAQGKVAPEQACRNITRLWQKGLDIMWEEEGGP